MGQISQSLGLGSELEFEGTVYKLSPWSYKIQGEFELYLQRKAVDAVRSLRPVLSQEEYDERMDRVVRDINVGVYTFGSKEVAAAMNSLPHLKHLFLLQLKHAGQLQATSALVDKVFEAAADLAIQKMAEAVADPTRRGKDSPAPSGDSPTA